jgi:hypothetical protein
MYKCWGWVVLYSIGVAKLRNGQASAMHLPPATWQIVGAELAGNTETI